MRALYYAIAGLTLTCVGARADNGGGPQFQNCSVPPGVVQSIQNQLASVVLLNNGGLFSPNLMWSAVVDRQGILCSVIKTGDAWPGSRAIAIAKAETANDFSNDKLALSTANLYGPTQPGGSLYGLNNSNPFNPFYNSITQGQGPGTGVNLNPGGIITFGGGVALYLNGQVIGGLGVSGDTSCADHAIAYRMRHAAGYDKIPNGPNNGTDNIAYYPIAPFPTPTVDPSKFDQPHCGSTDITP
jgi:uncharacterized protein GlcG (DUF336 family)